MSYVLGFVIALFIAITGVGAGTITVPVLVLFLGVPAPIAVSIGLTFSAVVKLILAPAQIIRGNVSWRTLAFMLAGGLPGVLIGSFLLKRLALAGEQTYLNAALGAILVTTASWQIFFSFRPMVRKARATDRHRWLPWLMLPVGAEVGFPPQEPEHWERRPAWPDRVDASAGGGHGYSLWFCAVSGGQWQPLAVWNQQPAVADAIAGGRAVRDQRGGTEWHIPRRPLRLVLWVWLLILGGQFLFNSYAAWAAPQRQTIGQRTAIRGSDDPVCGGEMSRQRNHLAIAGAHYS